MSSETQIFYRTKVNQQFRRQYVKKPLIRLHLAGREFDGTLARSNLADEGSERTRAAYQDEGYFNAKVTAGSVPAHDSSEPEFDIVIQVLDQGLQYRLGNFNIINAVSFPAQGLRDAFPIQQREIFSRKKIVEGLENLRHMYDREGYVNVTPVPNAQFDEANATANLTIDVDEGKQFRIRNIEVLAEDASTRDRVLENLTVKPGDIFDSQSWDRELTKFPGAAWKDPNTIAKKLDEKHGWVDLVLDLRKPPSCPNSAQ